MFTSFRLRCLPLILGLLPFALLAQLQSPSDYLPHRLGETFTPHHMLVDYFQHVAANTDHILLEEYGRTNEDRPLMTAIISSPENMRQLEAIRLNHLKRAGLAEGTPDPALDRAIVWLSYSVHGNEAAGSEASMGVVYELTRPDNREAQEWLRNVVVIMDPSVNPDGYSRYTHWYRGVSTTEHDPDPMVREHREPWPGGRVNHYLFDLNRDWAWQTQVESQQRIVRYQQWMPHIHADLHEQWYDNPYYFAPAAQPYHTYLSEWQGDFQVEIGKNHAGHFDENGWLYFTGEVFDLLYPSYGDTYPMFNGSIGMTYEQGGHSRGGACILLPNNDTLTLYDRVAHHLTTSLSTIEISAKRKEALVEEFTTYFDRSRNNPIGEYKTYIIKGDGPQGRLRALALLLDRNGIEYGTVNSRSNVSALNYQTGRTESITTNSTDLVVSAYQPRSVLTQVLLDPETEVVDSLTYDITAWSLPYAYGLQAYATTTQLSVQPGYDFAPVQALSSAEAYAYLIPWESVQHTRFLGQLLKAGIQVRTASTPFTADGRDYKRGTLVLTRADNRKMDGFGAKVRQLAQQENVQLYTASTGFTEVGPDLGSASFTLLDAPRVAMVAGDGTFANEMGQIWHYFEQRIDYPIHIYYTDDLEDWDVDNIDVLILPEGYYDMDSDAMSSLRSWVAGGGKVIAIGASLSAFAGQEGFGLSYKPATSHNEPTAPHQDHSYAGSERRSIPDMIPGAIFAVDIDNTHPLGYGLDNTYHTLKTSTYNFSPLDSGWNVGQIGSSPRVIGFAGSRAKAQTYETLTFGVQRVGGGQVVYLVDNPLYRGFWEQGLFLFGNALFMVD